MSREEARVVIFRLQRAIEDMRDVMQDKPPHVAQESGAHILAMEDAARELARIHGIGV